MTPEGLADLFRQLAFISALIGGFAFAFLGALLTVPSRSKVVGWAAGTALATAGGLIVCVVGWTLMAAQVVTTRSADAGAEGFRFPASLNMIHSRLSLLFIVGMLLFLTSLGLSGWVRSRSLGITSTVIALLAGVAMMFVLVPFLR